MLGAVQALYFKLDVLQHTFFLQEKKFNAISVFNNLDIRASFSIGLA